MAAGDITINILGDISKLLSSLDKAKQSLREFGTNAALIGAAGAAGFGLAIKAAGEQELVISKLTTALAKQGDASRNTVKDLIDYANALTKVTTYSDEQIESVETLLVQFGLHGQALKDATKATIDFSTRTGDLNTAAELIGKSYLGNASRLKMYGIEVADNIGKGATFSTVLDQIQKHYGGQAEAERNTFIGQLKATKVSFGELAENIGTSVLPMVRGFLDQLLALSESLRNMDPQMVQVIAKTALIGTTIATAIGVIALVVSKISLVNVAITLVVGAITLWITRWNTLKDSSITVFNFLLEKMNDVIRFLNSNLISAVNNVLEWVGKIGAKITTVGQIAHSSVMTMTGQSLQVLGKGRIDGIKEISLVETSVQSAVKESVKAVKEGTAAAVDTMNEFAKTRIGQLKQQITEERGVQTELTTINKLETEKRLLTAKGSFENTATFGQQLSVKLAESTKSWSNIFVNTITSIKDKFAAGMADMIVNGGKFRDVMADLGKQILQAFIEQVIAKMVAAFIAGIATMQAAQAGLAATSAATGAVGAATGAGAGAGLVGAGAIIGAGAGAAYLSNAAKEAAGEKYGGTTGTLAGILANPIGAQINFAKNLISNPGKTLSNAIGGIFGSSSGLEVHHEGRDYTKESAADVATKLGSPGWGVDWRNSADREAGFKAILDSFTPEMLALRYSTPGIQANINTNYDQQLYTKYKNDQWAKGWTKHLGLTGTYSYQELIDNIYKGTALPSGREALPAHAAGGIITEPTLLMSRSGMSTMAENGPEAIVPLNKMDQSGSGLTLIVNITGQFLEANEAVWQRLIREKINPEIQRFIMSSPTGAFIRRRGAVA